MKKQEFSKLCTQVKENIRREMETQVGIKIQSRLWWKVLIQIGVLSNYQIRQQIREQVESEIYEKAKI